MSDRPYIGRSGRRYSPAIEDWHPVVIKSLGIRKCTPDELTKPEKTTDKRVEKSS